MTKRSHDSSSIDFPVYSRFLLAVSGYAALYNRFRPFHKATLNSLHSPQQRANKHSNPLLSDGCYGCCRQLDATLNDVDYTLMIFFCVGQSKNRYNVIDVLQFRVVQSATSVAAVAKQRAAAFVCPLLRRVQTIQQRAMTCGHRRKCLRCFAPFAHYSFRECFHGNVLPPHNGAIINRTKPRQIKSMISDC